MNVEKLIRDVKALPKNIGNKGKKSLSINSIDVEII